MRDTLRRFMATLGIAFIGTTVVGAGIALAAELEVTPSAPAPGETELTLEISDFDPNTSIFAVPCAIPESGDATEVTTADCDVVAVEATITDDQGAATLTVTWEIPDGGIAVYVGDETRTNQVAEILTTEVLDGDDPDVEVLGTSTVQEPEEPIVQETNDTEDDLAETGPREVVLLLMAAAFLVALGGLSATAGRRFGDTPA